MLQGSKEDDQFMFCSARKGCRMVQAMAAEKANRLTSNAAEWLESDNTQAFEQKEFEARDYSADLGFETTCQFFDVVTPRIRHRSPRRRGNLLVDQLPVGSRTYLR